MMIGRWLLWQKLTPEQLRRALARLHPLPVSRIRTLFASKRWALLVVRWDDR